MNSRNFSSVSIIISAMFFVLLFLTGCPENGGNGDTDTAAQLTPAEYVEKMGLNEVSRERFMASPSDFTYAETVEFFVAEGVKLTASDDVPPEAFGRAWQQYPWPHAAEDPEMHAYLWINEHGFLMGLMFREGKRGPQARTWVPESLDEATPLYKSLHGR